MNRRNIILTLLIVIALSILPPLLLAKKTNDLLITASTILSALVSIVTLIIALLLYKKFGIEETIFSKQVETLFRLLKLIRSKTFWIETSNFKLHMPLSIMDRDINRFEQFKELPLLFCQDYYDFIDDIHEMANDYYMPKVVADKIKTMEPSFLSFPSNLIPSQYGKVGVASVTETKWGLQDDKKITLDMFVIQWVEVIECIKIWVKNHSKDKNKINL